MTSVVATGRQLGLDVGTHALVHRCGTWEVARLASPTPSSRAAARPILLVQAGLHGDEIAGPLTILRHLGAIAARAHARGVDVIVYPLVNPSGFDAGLRYNADNDNGDCGNGDFLRYLHDDGGLLDEPPPHVAAPAWRWSSELPVALPAETRLQHALLRRDPIGRVVAALDLHQDRLTPGVGPAAYAYAFGDVDRFRAVVDEVRALVPLLARREIGAGFGVQIDATGALTRHQAPAPHPTSDDDGFIVRRDGSFTDLFDRLGAPFSVAVETTGATPLDVAVAVNLAWIYGLVELAAVTTGCTRRS